MMGATMSKEPSVSDTIATALAFRKAQNVLRSFYRIGREATELGCRFDLLPGSPIVAEALKLVLEREAERDIWKEPEGITFSPSDIAISLIDISLYDGGIAQDAIDNTLSLACLVTDCQWGIVCGMVICGGYMEQEYGDRPAVSPDASQAVEWPSGRRPSWWGDIEVRSFLTSMIRQATLDQVCDMARQRFGEDRTPSRSSLNRYWRRLENKAGRVSPERDEEIRLGFLSN